MIGSDLAHADLVVRFGRARVLVVGDVMLDRYAFGTVERVSPEAPIPVLRMTAQSAALGGAGNVLRNLLALGARPTLVTVVGDDAEAAIVRAEVEASGVSRAGVLVEAGRPTTVKQRFIAGGQQLLRTDRETTEPIASASAAQLLDIAAASGSAHDLVILSDYGKGVLTPEVATGIIRIARELDLPVLVDSKARDYEAYRGARLITPNSRELARASRQPVGSDAQVTDACRRLAAAFDLGGVLATRGETGMTLVMRDRPEIHLRAEAKEVFDVTGAGDTVIAVLGAALASGADVADAASLANLAAGIVVGKIGAATVRPAEIVARLNERASHVASSKIVSPDQLLPQLARWRGLGMRIGFTNGCFDLLHPGHLSILQQARAACDLLVVGLNSDASVRRVKGEGRPIQDEAARAAVLASIASVDRVVLFDEDTPLRLIERIRPDVLVKGADYTIEEVVGAPFVRSYGGSVVLAEIRRGFSTTSTIERMSGRPAHAPAEPASSAASGP